YSALKMDGKPLYEYARSNTPLPRPIPSRKVTVSEISLLSFTEGSNRREDDGYEFPKEKLGEEEKLELERMEKMVKEGKTVLPDTEEVEKAVDAAKPTVEKEETTTESQGRPPIFEISLTVSSGTYIRSVVHDLGIALGSSAHVVKLTRTRQGQFSLYPSESTSTTTSTEATTTGGEAQSEGEEKKVEKVLRGCVEWTMLEKAIERQDKVKKGSQEAKDELDKERGKDGDGYLEWEREILKSCETV
ncbi:hypothetical protein JCM16303_003027, partial [Sporobolomyces ruberrimus]